MLKTSQSILDQLFRSIPFLEKSILKNENLTSKAAEKLFQFWKQSPTKIGKNVYQRPTTLSMEDVMVMERSGLARAIGSNLEITKKGNKAIRVMILGDENSIFDEEKDIKYHDALAKMKAPTIRTADVNKQPNDNWWNRFLNQS